MKRFAAVISATLLFALSSSSFAQGTSKPEDAAAYTKVITGRAEKIVSALNISDKKKADRVTSIIVEQYRIINEFHENKNQRIKELKAVTEKSKLDTTLKLEATASSQKLAQIHGAYIAQLQKELSSSQIEQVKDAMTYNVLPITYKAFQEMLPSLTAAQKEMILKNLTEARELAMDAESSDAKHAVFGKYKGRINNKLTAEGYDLKKEGEEWQKRIKASAQAKQ